MRGHWAYLFGGGLGLVMLALAAGLQAGTVAASPQSDIQVATRDATMAVNRTLKGDRLVLPATSGKPADGQSVQNPQAKPKLPDGCEAAVSAMTRSSLAQTAGRCIS
jgi:hypothetical protein